MIARFLLVFAVAAAAFFAARYVPFLTVAMLLRWAIVAAAAWWFARSSAQAIATASDPSGRALGMGALVAAALVGADLLAGSFGHRLAADTWARVALTLGILCQLLLGAAGGLAGWLSVRNGMPAANRSSPALLWLSLGLGAVALLVTFAVGYVIALAHAMSDAPG